jgi:hypothetical protein
MLKTPQRPSEKVCFRETFINESYVKDNGGTTTGSPTIKNGVVLDGSTQNVVYTSDLAMKSNTITIEVVFNPSFAVAEAVNRYLLDSDTPRYFILKRSDGDMDIYLGGTSIVKVASATYSGYWNVGQKNTLVIASNGTTTDVYLNNVKIVDADATAWTAGVGESFTVGSRESSTSFLFAGTIHSVTFYKAKWTAEEVADAYQADTFTEIDASKAVLFLPCRSTFIEPTGVNLVVDGDCEATGVAAWTVANDATLTKSIDSPQAGTQALRVAYNGISTPGAYQTIVPVGKRYRITGYARGDGSFAPQITTGAGAAIVTGLTSSTSWQYYDVIFIAINSTIIFRSSATSAGWAEFDTMTAELAPTVTENIGTGINGVMGDGSTAATIPAQQTPHGYLFSLADEYIDSGSDIIGTGDVTIGAMVKNNSWTETAPRIITNGKTRLAGNGASSVFTFTSDGSTFASSAVGSFPLGQHLFVVATRTSAGLVNYYINGEHNGADDITSGTPVGGDYNVLVGNDNISRSFDGIIDKPFVFNSILTPTQIRELSNQAFSNLNI